MMMGMRDSAGLMASIITSTPMAVVIWVTAAVRFWLTALLMVSTSLVMTLRISPWVWLS